MILPHLLCIPLVLFPVIAIDTVATIRHAVFSNVTVPSGLSSILFIDLPPDSAFVVIQLHSPFNPLLVSVLESFDYGASQHSEHCGLLMELPVNSTNVTLFIYSEYETSMPSWVRADAYATGYPMPGGCGQVLFSGVSNAALATEVMQLPWNLVDRNDSCQSLRYWTSLLKFPPAAASGKHNGSSGCLAVDDRITYYLYTTPLVTAGGLYGTFTDPNSYDVSGVLDVMSSWDVSPQKLAHTFIIRASMLDEKQLLEVPIARRPGTAVVLTLVAELRDQSRLSRVAYAPVVLYGCPATPPIHSEFGVGLVVRNQSCRLSCGILPTNSPSIYFPVAVLLLASMFYACSCNLLIWPRCAASVMVMSSVLGTIFFYRYSLPTSDAMLVLAISVLLPGLLALATFILIWCLCIRPTLHYHRVFGRGPLMKIQEPDTTPGTSAVTEPWNTELLDRVPTEVQGAAFYVADSDPPFENSLEPVSEVPNYGTLQPLLSHSNSSTTHVCQADMEQTQLENDRPPFCPCCSSQHNSQYDCAGCRARRSTRVFSLRPRRIARLPPVLPAVFLFVALLSVLLGQLFSLNDSPASYLSFVILMGVFILCPLCVFKNLAFGLSTAFVGVYLSLGCVCLFLIPNAFMPHILIEQFLRLTWIEHRLAVLQFNAVGLYDLLIFATWIIGTTIFGLLTLCLIRLQDARELSEAQRGRLLNPISQYQASGGASNIHPSSSFLWNDGTGVSRCTRVLGNRLAPTGGATGADSGLTGGITPVTGSLVLGTTEFADSAGRLNSKSVPSTNRPFSERSQLLSAAPRISYGGLANTAQPSLMPLSRVQLACGTGVGNRLSNNNFRYPGSQSQPSLTTPLRMTSNIDDAAGNSTDQLR
ncbi:hypothetical protein CSKR_107013 [Clonorchis sinensis]|uniref:Transmembrane protein n=1 Tax=Clonorchis sinensis TaxID=79923 RepID=A0A8T1ME32_CLOSI|nr:hypothetical protein CSKR_107013 [Clonorchis sinensis]